MYIRASICIHRYASMCMYIYTYKHRYASMYIFVVCYTYCIIIIIHMLYRGGRGSTGRLSVYLDEEDLAAIGKLDGQLGSL